METRELSIPDAFVFTPVSHQDDRGAFLEWFKADVFETVTGRRFDIRQANTSVSRKGVVRGIHFAQIAPGQAKYVTCTQGRVLDFVVDIRLGSPTFGVSEAVELTENERNAVFIPEGLGHMFVALTDHAVVSYLVNQPFSPGREHAISPLDQQLALQIPHPADELVFSPKDAGAPTLSEVEAIGLLPTFTESRALYRSLAVTGDNR